MLVPTTLLAILVNRCLPWDDAAGDNPRCLGETANSAASQAVASHSADSGHWRPARRTPPVGSRSASPARRIVIVGSQIGKPRWAVSPGVPYGFVKS